MADKTHTRAVKRVRREQVITVTIPAMVLTIDAKIEGGKLLIGVAGPQGMVVSNPISVVPSGNRET